MEDDFAKALLFGIGRSNFRQKKKWQLETTLSKLVCMLELSQAGRSFRS